MRRLVLQKYSFVFAALLFLLSPACKKMRRPFQRTDEQIFSSVANAGDPREAQQFRKGFYGVEANAWRWTGKHFQVVLSPPRRQAGKTVQLVLKLSVPDTVIKSLGPIRLSAAMDGFQYAPQDFAEAGSFTYARDVPPNRLTGDRVVVDFDLDKAMPPTATDYRELGIIVSQAGLIAR